jgi:aspartate/methionine/tyrosine aminotransferase
MKFPKNDIIALLDDRQELNLAESTNVDLRLIEIWEEAWSSDLRSLKLEYGTSQGDAELRLLIAEKLNVDSNQLVITNGSIFGIFLSVLSTCNQGDRIITVQPNFPPTMDLIEGLGFEKKLIQLSFENNYELNLEELFSSINSKTKLIILVTPLNPTGTTISKDKILKVARKLKEEYPQCKLLIDETYREASYGDTPITPSLSGIMDNVLTVSSLSKCHGAPGIRLGWLHSLDPDLISDVCTIKMNTVISNSVLDEFIAKKILQNENVLLKRRKVHSLQGFETTKEWVSKNSEYIEWVSPNAGALCTIRLRKEKFDDKGIKKLYEQAKHAKVQLASGKWFGESPYFMRIGFGYLTISQLNESLNILGHLFKVCRLK